MRILLSNDDGVQAPGLQALAAALEGLGDVYVVAPDRDRSGTGHAITVHEPLEIAPVVVEGARRAYRVSGTPADCVKLGVLELFDGPPDLVVTGINPGANLGIDVLYSGTVSGAAEGTLLGMPALAISIAGDQPLAALGVARSVARWLVTWMAAHRPLPPGTFFNVNLPSRMGRFDPHQVVWTRLAVNRRYRDAYAPEPSGDGARRLRLIGGADEGDTEDGQTDAGAVAAGQVSVTPIHFDLTDYRFLQRQGIVPGSGLVFPMQAVSGN